MLNSLVDKGIWYCGGDSLKICFYLLVYRKTVNILIGQISLYLFTFYTLGYTHLLSAV